MTMENIIVILIVGVAVAFVGRNLYQKFKKTSHKMTFKNVIKEFKGIYPNEEIGEDIKQQIVETLKKIENGEIKDPLKVKTPFSDNFLTNPIHERRIIQKLADLLKFPKPNCIIKY